MGALSFRQATVLGYSIPMSSRAHSSEVSVLLLSKKSAFAVWAILGENWGSSSIQDQIFKQNRMMTAIKVQMRLKYLTIF